MGEVFEALDQKLGERVAIKVIAREFTLDTGLLERFYRAEALSESERAHMDKWHGGARAL